MAGKNHFKKGPHPTRRPGFYAGALTSEGLIRINQLTNHQITARGIRTILESVALASHAMHRNASQASATVIPADTRRQLQAMLRLKSKDALALAIENCDIQTRAAVTRANNINYQAEGAVWVPSEDPDSLPGTQVPEVTLETMRRDVTDALAWVLEQKAARGPKVKPYQSKLARAILEAWEECMPPRSSGRDQFARFVFELASIQISQERRNRLLADAGKTPHIKE